MRKGGNKIQVWIKLQRKIKSVNTRIEAATCQKTRSRLLRKLKMLVNRLFTLNRKWRIGIAAATLLLWLGNHDIQAQALFENPIHFETYAGTTLYNGGTPSMYKPDLVDIDNDGDLDIFCGTNKKVFFHENTGTPEAPEFAAYITDPFGIVTNQFDALAPRFVDIDGDGDFDVLGVEYSYGTLLLYENIGTPESPDFQAPIENPYGFIQYDDDYSSNAIDLADIDGDGDFDLIVSTYDGDVVFYENLGNPEAADFSVQSVNPFGISDYITHSELGSTELKEGTPALTDVDKDGDFDLFIGTWDNDIQFFENTGTASVPAFASPVKNPFGITIPAGNLMSREAPAFGDLDNDGDEDMFLGFSQYPSFYYYMLSKSPIEFSNLSSNQGFTVISENPGWNKETAFGDFNGDGKEDFVFSSQNNDGQVLFGTDVPAATVINLDTLNGTDGFSAITNESNYDVALVDINKDGFDDVVFGQPYAATDRGNNYVLFGHSGTQDAIVDLENPVSNELMVMSPSQSTLFSGYYEFNVGDINGDGFDDLYSVGYYEDPSGVILFADSNIPSSLDIDADINAGNGCIINFPYPTLQTGDFNGDGLNDILTKISSAHWAIIWGQAIIDKSLINPYSEQDNAIATKIEVWGMDAHQSELDAVLDFNNDGYDDMLFRNFTEVYRGAPGKDTLNLIYGHAMPFEAYFLDIWNRPQDALDGLDGRYITGLQAGQQISSVATLDFNNDDFEDVIFAIEPANEVYVVYGSNDGQQTTDISNLSPAQGFKINSFKTGPVAVNKGGNLNGDAFDDLIVLDKSGTTVIAHIVYGQQTDKAAYAVSEIQGSNGYDVAFNETINAIHKVENPDFNGDGYEDAVLAIHEIGGNSIFKFLLSEEQCIPIETVEDIAVCFGEDYTLPDGTIIANITENISYVSNLVSQVNGCDSLVTSNIIVNEINTSVSTEGNTLTAGEANADTYQWLDCELDNAPIDGATNFEFSAPKSGDYALVIEKDGCTETSACITLLITGLEDVGALVQRIWPNPSTGKVNIHLNEHNQMLELFIQDISGRVLLHKDVAPGETNFTTELPAPSGVYFIQLISNLKTATYKVIKK